MSGLATTLGRRIGTLRKHRGMTQQMLGQAAGIDYKHLGAIERGEKSPTLETIEKMARALGVEAYELLIPVRFIRENGKTGRTVTAAIVEQLDRESLEKFVNTVLAAAQNIEGLQAD